VVIQLKEEKEVVEPRHDDVKDRHDLAVATYETLRDEVIQKNRKIKQLRENLATRRKEIIGA